MEIKTKIIIAVVSIIIIITIFIILFLTLRRKNTSVRLTGGYNDYYEDENLQGYKLIDDDLTEDFINEYKNYNTFCDLCSAFLSEYPEENMSLERFHKRRKNIITNKNAYKLVFGDDYVSLGHQRLAVIYPNDISKKIVINKTITVDGKEYEVVFPRDLNTYFMKNTNLERFIVTDLLHPTTNITNLSHMFYCCTKLREIKLCKNFVTDNVEHMDYMVYNTNIRNISFINNFNFSKVLTVQSMFSKSKLRNINLSKIDLSSVRNTNDLFSYSNRLMSIKMPKFNGNCNTLACKSMFDYCRQLFYVDFIDFNIEDVNLNSPTFNNITSDFLMSVYPKHGNTIDINLLLSNFNIAKRKINQIGDPRCKLYDINCNNSYFGN